MPEREMITAGAVYTHYKGGRYEIVSVAHDATDAREGSKVVVYRSLEEGTVYCRDMEEFVAEVVWPDGVTRPRFIAADAL